MMRPISLVSPLVVRVALVAGLVGGLAVGAEAAITPSTAPLVQLGVPFVAAGQPDEADVWRLNADVRPGDKLQIAVDNTNGTEELRVCALGPIDDFGYDKEVAAACDFESQQRHIVAGHRDRLTVTYQRATGQPLIRFESFADRDTNYTATVERLIPKIVLGATPKAIMPRTFKLLVVGRYGDNTPIDDGFAGYLRWRYFGEKKKSARRLVSATSAGGGFTFATMLPKRTEGRKVVLEACAIAKTGATLSCWSRTVAIKKFRA